MNDSDRLHSRSLQSQLGGQLPRQESHASQEQEPDGPRAHGSWQSEQESWRSQTGLLVALGISAVNGYVWYRWHVAERDVVRGGRSADLQFLLRNAACGAQNWREGRYWTLLTAGFSHIQTWHLFANTLAVVSFLPTVAVRLGVGKTVAAYGLAIVGGSVASLWQVGVFDEPRRWQAQATQSGGRSIFGRATSPPPPSQSRDSLGLGASAGVFGLFTISTMLAPTARVAVFFIPLPAWLAWGMLVGVDAYCAANQQGREKMASATGISIGHEAHLGGVAVGVASAVLLNPRFWLRR